MPGARWGGQHLHPQSTVEIQPLGGRPAEPSGWLALHRPAAPSTAERMVLSHAVSLITLELARGADAAAPVGAAVESALLRTAVTEPGAAEAVRAVLAQLGPQRDRVVLVGLRAEREGSLARAVARGRATTTLLAAEWSWDGRGPGALLLLPDPARLTATEGVATGVGRPARLADLPAALESVRRALDRAGPGELVSALDLPLDALLDDPALDRALAASAGPWLARLAEYDAAHGTELLGSLRAFLRHHGVLDPAARELAVHRHTLRHRMDRVGQVAGCDLADPTHRALLVLALT